MLKNSFSTSLTASLAIFTTMLFFSAPASAIGLAQNFSFDGVLVNEATGVPLTGPVALRFQIYDPAGICLLFQEEHAAVPLQADGSFNLKVGSGTRASGSIDGGLALRTIFQNNGTVRATATPNCNPGFTPAAGDGRNLRVTVNATTLTPDYSISPMPMATVAETLQGRDVTDFVSSNSATSLTGPMTLSNQGEVRFASSTANYVSLRAPATVPASVFFYLPATDGANGACLTTNGAGQLTWAACGGGGTPTGAAGGSLTGTYPNPTLLATGVTPASYPKVTVNAEGRVTAGLALTNADLAPIAFMGDVSGTVNTMSVDRIRSYAVSATAPMNGSVLRYNAGLVQWEPQILADFSMGGSMTGALAITAGGLNVTAGSVSIPSGTAATPSLQVGSTSYGIYNAGAAIGFSAAGMERMRITNSGNIGIGTPTPAERLDVMGNASVQGDVRASGTIEQTSMSSSSSPGIAIFDSLSGIFNDGMRMGFTTGGIGRVYIDASNGRVGVGTANPAAMLDVVGTAKLQKNTSPPVACNAGSDAVLAMTSTYTMCVCNSSVWVRVSDGTTVCTWL